MADFIDNDEAQAVHDGEFDGDDNGARAAGNSTQALSQHRAAAAASMALQDAGFRAHQSDADYFAAYIEYMVYDLVDKTFAVRVVRDRQLHRQYQEALRKIEEQLSGRR